MLDIFRGLAILGIFYLNVASQAGSTHVIYERSGLISWTAADRLSFVWAILALEGTQRAMLEFLFGAGMILLTARAMRPDDPVAVADLYYRRALWLLVFGMIDVFVMGWHGDVLTVYALAALFLFPFRRLGPRALLALGMGYLVVSAGIGLPDYLATARKDAQLVEAIAHVAAHQPLSADDRRALDDERAQVEAARSPSPEVKARSAKELAAHQGGWLLYMQQQWAHWWRLFPLMPGFVGEAACAMLLGAAMWKWGILQGTRSTRFYVMMAIASYAVALPVRVLVTQHFWTRDWMFTFYADFMEVPRLAMALGHVAVVNLLFRTSIGAVVLAPFKAAGRTAFSLYFLQQLVGLHILFSPYGFNLWNRVSWWQIGVIATAMYFGLLLVANLWLRFFMTGPLEWAWRSLAYVEMQPFRKVRGT